MMWRDYNWRNNMVPQREYMAGYCDETGTPFLEIPGYNLQGLMRYQVKKDHYLKSFREGDTRLKGTLKAVYKKHEDGTLEYIAPIQYKFKEPPWKVATKEVGTMIILSIAMRMPCYY